MKRIFCVLLSLLLLCGCVSQTKKTAAKNEVFCGVWISCYELYPMLKSGNFKEEFTAAADNLALLPCSDAFVHVRAFSDALFNSEYNIFNEYAVGYDFDIIKFMIDTLADRGIKFHAWINPFRTAESVFANPADTGVRKTVVQSVREIIENYDVAGVHFDDYFYPADNEEIDAQTYAEYAKTATNPLDKKDWRTANISALIYDIQALIDNSGKDILFSVSPSADIQKNENVSCADIKAWCERGAVDMVIPQLYFGFDYPAEEFRFENLLATWKGYLQYSEAMIVIGLAPYKLGITEGPDCAEWQNGTDILALQTKICLGDPVISGVCYFSYSSLFADTALHTASLKGIKDVLASYIAA